MCLIVFAWKLIPGMPLIAAANRDEFHDRPTAPASWWEDAPHIYAGRDLLGGGTWMGMSRQGRFAAVTNVRAPDARRSNAPSRGLLAAEFLQTDTPPLAYVHNLAPAANAYSGFNLLVGDRDNLVWFSNRVDGDHRCLNAQPLPPGIYGLSNAGTLDSRWPKVTNAKAQFASLLCQGAPDEAWFDMLADCSIAPDQRLPDTGVSHEWERLLSAICIVSPQYGTRSSTLLRLFDDGTSSLLERTLR